MLINPSVGWSWLKPVRASRCIQPALGWTLSEYDSHNQVLRQEWRRFNDEAPTWSQTVENLDSSYIPHWDCLDPDSFKSFSSSLSSTFSPHVQRWKDESLAWNACRVKACVSSSGMCVTGFMCQQVGAWQWFVQCCILFCEQNWFWCPEGIQFASCCVL